MDRDQAIEALKSGSSHERLKAARLLRQIATARDLSTLKQVLRSETVSFVKAALMQAIERLEHRPQRESLPPPDDEPIEIEIERVAYIKAVEWVSASLLHEILPRLGAIRLEARRVVDDYNDSELKKKVDALAFVLNGIEEIRRASKAEQIKQFNLYNALRLIVAEVSDHSNLNIFLQGPHDLVVTGDQSLLVLAVGNALRNAVEACAQIPDCDPIIISWGSTDVDNWITILDHGPGIAGPLDAAFEIGRTNKSGHRGFGLSIARQAMITLDGSIQLQSAVGGGTRAEVRWFI